MKEQIKKNGKNVFYWLILFLVVLWFTTFLSYWSALNKFKTSTLEIVNNQINFELENKCHSLVLKAWEVENQRDNPIGILDIDNCIQDIKTSKDTWYPTKYLEEKKNIEEEVFFKLKGAVKDTGMLEEGAEEIQLIRNTIETWSTDFLESVVDYYIKQNKYKFAFFKDIMNLKKQKEIEKRFLDSWIIDENLY